MFCINPISYYHAAGSRGRVGRVLSGVCLFVCLFVHTISQKPMGLGSPNLIKSNQFIKQKDRLATYIDMHEIDTGIEIV